MTSTKPIDPKLTLEQLIEMRTRLRNRGRENRFKRLQNRISVFVGPVRSGKSRKLAALAEDKDYLDFKTQFFLWGDRGKYRHRPPIQRELPDSVLTRVRLSIHSHSRCGIWCTNALANRRLERLSSWLPASIFLWRFYSILPRGCRRIHHGEWEQNWP